jgi:hypothetical protein
MKDSRAAGYGASGIARRRAQRLAPTLAVVNLGEATMWRALQLSFVLSVMGTLFSGVLSYRELFGQTALACPAPGAPGTLLGYPACVYGFFMFLALAIVTGLGLWAGSRDTVLDVETFGARRG